jgi:hypothetical protein
MKSKSKTPLYTRNLKPQNEQTYHCEFGVADYFEALCCIFFVKYHSATPSADLVGSCAALLPGVWYHQLGLLEEFKKRRYKTQQHELTNARNQS